MRRSALVLLLVLATTPARAAEGMWTFDHAPLARFERTYGVTLDTIWLRHLRLSTVRLHNGCTGSFVSADGLVLTNHHCAQEAIVENSSAGHDLLANGFLARTRAEELPCGSFEIEVLVGMVEVTAKVEAALNGLDDARANEARKRVLSDLELAYERGSRRDSTDEGLLCEAVTLYQGGRYAIYEYRRYRDVRLVFAPEIAAANFGGDPDNFQYPRWNLDMALLRVYEHGQPAHTPDFLRIDPEGPRAGEAVFVSGHPARTDRLLALAQLHTERDDVLPRLGLLYSELRGRLLALGARDPETQRQSQDALLDLENSLKVRRGQLAALLADSLFAAKAREEGALRARATADPALRALVGDAWQRMAKAQVRARELGQAHDLVELRFGTFSNLWGYANVLVRGTAERAKPNGERLREYAESELPALAQRLLAPTPVYPAIEQVVLSFWLERQREYLGIDDPFVRATLGAEAPESLATRLVRGTRLGDAGFRRQLWEGGAAAVQASDDPLLAFARRIDAARRALRKQWEDEVEAPTAQAAEHLARARFRAFGTQLYPDATFTLRLNDGRVEGWTERGAPVAPFTTFAQAFERATGVDPLALPPSWLAARGAIAPATPFNFCTSNDIVGGNSGSPIVDARGVLVGLAFDGNFESIAGSYGFDPRDNRTVAVHPAAIRAALSRIYHADALVRELGLGE